MTRVLAALLILVTLTSVFWAAPACAQGNGTYVVQPGDTMLGIAARYGVSAADLAVANGLVWGSWVYAGQRLIIPGVAQMPSFPTDATYVVQPGDTLQNIGLRLGVTVADLMNTNRLVNADFIYVGQRLVLPSAASNPGPAPAPAQQPQPAPSLGAKWIEVNLTDQTLVAYADQAPVFRAVVSAGTVDTPTVVGTFSIYAKYEKAPMYGPDYYLPDVPYIMYFYTGYSLHGTYWHNNFGTPMSHGCVNLSTPDAEWLYNWADVGTTVVTHY